MEAMDCKYVLDINGTQEKCDFVKNNSHCQESEGIFNYVQVLYCDFEGPGRAYLAIGLFAMWLLVLFIGLAVSADDYFCPNLASISKTLRLPHNIAGVTILAFGNGAPDIFSAISAVNQQRPELVLGALFGAGVFVSTFVAGSVCVAKPFKLMERPFLRDIVFYIGGGFWAFCIFYRGEIRLLDSVGFLILYVVYIVVVIVGRVIHQRIRARRPSDRDEILDDNNASSQEEEIDEDTGAIFVPKHMVNNTPVVSNVPEDPEGGSNPCTNNDLVDADLDTIVSQPSEQWVTFSHFCSRINPIKEWREVGALQKVWNVLKAPVVFLFTVTIPIVDDELENKGWCQSLHALQLVLLSQFMTFATNSYSTITFLDFHLWQLALMLSLVATIGLLCTSSPKRPPPYMWLLAFIGFAVSVVWIYLIANEIVSILKAFGVFFGLSDAILGLTVLAWGNSISDLIADVAIAKQGFPRMGFSACFGGPLLNLLIGIGLPFTIYIVKHDGAVVKVGYNNMVLVLSAALGVALITSLILMPASKFQATRLHGILLMALYAVLLTCNIVVEFFTT